MPTISANFDFLTPHDPQLVRLGALAERYFRDDPNTCLIKLRQFGELLAQLTAARAGLFISAGERQVETIRRLRDSSLLPYEVAELLHQLRQAGNSAAHGFAGDHALALSTLKFARQIGVWFHRTFADAAFAPGPFVPPPDPAAATDALHAELRQLRELAAAARSEAEQARVAAEAAARERMS